MVRGVDHGDSAFVPPQVCALDTAHFGAQQAKLTLYFGVDDGWVNDTDTAWLVEAFPQASVERCAESHGHAFVLTQRSSEGMGDRVASWCLAAAEEARATGGVARANGAAVADAQEVVPQMAD